jgi:hypothetical protein
MVVTMAGYDDLSPEQRARWDALMITHARDTETPLEPGQCWAALKGHLTGLIERDTAVKATAEHPVDIAIEGAIGAYRHVLAKMTELEG